VGPAAARIHCSRRHLALGLAQLDCVEEPVERLALDLTDFVEEEPVLPLTHFEFALVGVEQVHHLFILDLDVVGFDGPGLDVPVRVEGEGYLEAGTQHEAELGR